MAQKNRKTRYIIAFAAMLVILVVLFCWNVGAGVYFLFMKKSKTDGK